MKREDVPFPERKRAHIVINPKTELAYYIFKFPFGRKRGLLRERPLVSYEELCPAFRQKVLCVVAQPTEKQIGKRLAQLYKNNRELIPP